LSQFDPNPRHFLAAGQRILRKRLRSEFRFLRPCSSLVYIQAITPLGKGVEGLS
jgi:hypothetical protein